MYDAPFRLTLTLHACVDQVPLWPGGERGEQIGHLTMNTMKHGQNIGLPTAVLETQTCTQHTIRGAIFDNLAREGPDALT